MAGTGRAAGGSAAGAVDVLGVLLEVPRARAYLRRPWSTSSSATRYTSSHRVSADSGLPGRGPAPFHLFSGRSAPEAMSPSA